MKRVLLDSELAPTTLDLFQDAKLETDVVALRPGLLGPLVQHGDYGALLLRNRIPVPLSVLEAAGPSLKVIGIVGDSLDNINLTDASQRGILIKATDYVNAYEVANLSLHLMVMLLSRAFRHREANKARVILDAQEFLSEEFSGFELAGATIGLIGCGRAAQTLAMEMQPYCDRIIGYDNNPRSVYETFHQRTPLERSIIEYAQLSEVLEFSDVISIHTAGDDRVFKGKELYFAKRRPFIINTSRNGNIDEESLLAALREKRVRGAALVLPADKLKKGELEPWATPFLELKNVIIAPAVGNLSGEMTKKGTRRLAQAVIDFLKEKDLSLAVNPMDIVPKGREIYPMTRGARRGSIPILLGQ